MIKAVIVIDNDGVNHWLRVAQRYLWRSAFHTRFKVCELVSSDSWNALLLIWINSVPSMDEYMCSEMWGDITYQFLNLNICTIEV